MSTSVITDTATAAMVGYHLIHLMRSLKYSFFLGRFPGDFRAKQLLTRPRSFWIRFCENSAKCFAMMWRGFTSHDVLPAMSVRILQLVHSVSRPIALTPLQRTGRTIPKTPLKKLPLPCTRSTKGRIEKMRPIQL